VPDTRGFDESSTYAPLACRWYTNTPPFDTPCGAPMTRVVAVAARAQPTTLYEEAPEGTSAVASSLHGPLFDVARNTNTAPLVPKYGAPRKIVKPSGVMPTEAPILPPSPEVEWIKVCENANVPSDCLVASRGTRSRATHTHSCVSQSQPLQRRQLPPTRRT